MTKVRVNAYSISIDGYGAGTEQSLADPLGRGGEALHEWFVPTRGFQRVYGREGGSTGIDDEMGKGSMDNLGAWIMGRNMFGPGRDDAEWDLEWQGWWGDDPPYHAPVFVLTHHPREPLTLSDTTFHFVTDGLDAALERAREAAGDDAVHISGGGSTIDQALRAGAVDELTLHVAPVVLGAGVRLFEDVGDLRLEPIEATAGTAVHVRYRPAR